MALRTELYNAWAYPQAPTAREHDATSGTSGTFQQTTTDELGKLHVLTSNVDLNLLGGTGSSVTSTSGLFWPANVPFYYVPTDSNESIGYSSADGSTTFDGTSNFLTVHIVRAAPKAGA